MTLIRKIGLDFTVTALFGLTALFLSLLVGLMAGIQWDTVLLRSLLFLGGFAALGFGIMEVLKRFIPEVYGLISERWDTQETEAAFDASAAPAAEPEAGELPGDADAPPAEGFSELKGEDLARMGGRGGNARMTADQNRAKMGKHLIEKEKVAQYEPKILAQAIRTMMSKDTE